MLICKRVIIIFNSPTHPQIEFFAFLMKYNEILKTIAAKENRKPREIEKEMKAALKAAGLECSVKEFIETTSLSIRNRLYIV